MSKTTVTIERAKTAPACVLWDGRKSHGDDGKAPVPLVVTVEQAADVIGRDPNEWTLPVAGDVALVNAEHKRRSAPAPASPGGGN